MKTELGHSAGGVGRGLSVLCRQTKSMKRCLKTELCVTGWRGQVGLALAAVSGGWGQVGRGLSVLCRQTRSMKGV